MAHEVQSVQFRVTPRILRKPENNDPLSLEDFVELKGAASVLVHGRPGQIHRVGFVQVVTGFAFEARYNAGVAGADTTWRVRVAGLPMRDAPSEHGKPWYDPGEPSTPEARGMAFKRCQFEDNPSGPRLPLVHAQHGALQELSFALSFITWICVLDTTPANPAPPNARLVALREFRTGIRLNVRDIPAAAPLSMLTPPIITSLQPAAANIGGFPQIWRDPVPNRNVVDLWMVSDAARRLIADRAIRAAVRPPPPARPAPPRPLPPPPPPDIPPAPPDEDDGIVWGSAGAPPKVG